MEFKNFQNFEPDCLKDGTIPCYFRYGGNGTAGAWEQSMSVDGFVGEWQGCRCLDTCVGETSFKLNARKKKISRYSRILRLA